MNEIIHAFEQSIEDQLLSKPEKKDLKQLIGESALDFDQVNFLRSKVYDIARQRMDETNFQFAFEWVREATNLLVRKSTDKTVAFFSPGETCRQAIVHEINAAVTSLRICVFTISDDRIAEAILMAHHKRLDIRIITDNDKSLDLGSDIARLARAGLPVKMDNTSNHMHHKFLVADNRVVITGSYNWTSSAARFNYENIVSITEPGVVKSFLNEFNKLWPEMSDYRP